MSKGGAVAQQSKRKRPSGRGRTNDNRRTARLIILLVTAIVVVGAIAAGLLFALRPASSVSTEGASVALPASANGTGGRPAANVPLTPAAELDKAADAVGFHQTAAASVGVVENLPATTPMLTPSATLLPVGIVAPDFTLSAPNGTKVRLSDYRGKAILLEFFATWCPHCQAEAQHLLRIYQGLPASDFAFLSVNADSEDAASIHAFGRYFSIPWPELLDRGSPQGSFAQAGGPGQVTQSYGIGLYPTFFIIDKKGKIAWRSDREQPDMLLLQQLQNASGS